jgi:hypothetical protein
MRATGIAPRQSSERDRVRNSAIKGVPGYRQRESFFFSAFDLAGYRELVYRLVCGKRFLERTLYDGKREVEAFRPGSFDAGSTEQESYIYYTALAAAGLRANSGITVGALGTNTFHVGSEPGRNVARVTSGSGPVLELSPIAFPGGAINPVVPVDYEALAGSGSPDEMPVIVSVFHLNHLQTVFISNQTPDPEQTEAKTIELRSALEDHFRTIAELRDQHVLYPITMRELIEILSES